MAPQCPRCGHPIAKASATNKGTRPAFIAIALVVAVGCVAAYFLASPQTRNEVNRTASAVGVPVVPWTERAKTAAGDLYRKQGDVFASNILNIVHPTGKAARLASYDVTVEGGGVLVSQLEVEWKGGLLGQKYSTSVEWRCSETGHLSARVLSDTAMIPVAANNANQLDTYFRTDAFPLIKNNAN